jgi:hypothetical protein
MMNAWTLTAGLGAHWQPTSTIDGVEGLVTIQELGIDMNLGTERSIGAWMVFARGHASVSALLARGTSFDGPRGFATVFSPSVGLDVGVRWALSDSIHIVGGVVSDVALIRQRFLVDGVVTADLRRGQIGVAAGLAITLP